MLPVYYYRPTTHCRGAAPVAHFIATSRMDRLFGEGADDAVQEPSPEACVRTRESLLMGGFEDYKDLDGAVESFCYERGGSVRLVHHVIKRQDGKIVKFYCSFICC